MGNKVVILGTAHGANVAGKQSPDGRLREYKYSREICARVKDALTSEGIECHIDYEPDLVPLNSKGTENLAVRVAVVNGIAKRVGASNCIYVSSHNNAAGCSGWRTARGFCVYVSSNASEASKRMARIIQDHAIELGLEGNRCYPKTGYYIEPFYVIKNTTCPAVLTENLFQDNKSDVEFLLSDAGKDTIVRLHVDAIKEYLGV